MAAVSFNKVVLMGNLGREPEVHVTSSGRTVARFPLATHRQWRDAQGESQQQTDWHTIVVWGKPAEACGQYLTTGRLVLVEGELRSRTYESGEGEQRFVVEIVAQRVQFVGSGTKTEAEEGRELAEEELLGLAEDEVPF